jgi:hypothetical protein
MLRSVLDFLQILMELLVFVPDMRSRDHEVVVVRRTINLGIWKGGEWRGVEKGEVSS